MGQTLLSEVVSELGDEDAGLVRTAEIPRERVERWIKADEIDVMGAAYALLSDPRHVARIRPRLELGEVSAFLQRYFARCVHENPQSEWADSRYSAGWDVAGLFLRWWRDAHVPRELLQSWKDWLRDLYLKGAADVRECIETAILEHIFEVSEPKRFFADWLKEPTLAAAYRRSLQGPAGYMRESPDSGE